MTSTNTRLAVKPNLADFQIDGQTLHLANIGGEPHVVSADVSSLVPKLKGKDAIVGLLEIRNVKTKPVVVFKGEESNMEFLEECLM